MNQPNAPRLPDCHVDNDPAVRAALDRCAAMEARRAQLAADSKRLGQQLVALRKGEGATSDPQDVSLARVMRSDVPAAVAPKLEELGALHAATLRDGQALDIYLGKERLVVDRERRASTRARVRQSDFVHALRSIASAVQQLASANAAMRQLVKDVVTNEGRSCLMDCDFQALTILHGDVDDWCQNAGRLAHVDLKTPAVSELPPAVTPVEAI